VILSDSEVAISAAEAGSVVLRDWYGKPLSHFAKSSTDFATEADLESERAILTVIAAARPADALVGEESGHTGRSNRTWLVDPLCGTLNYAAETCAFAVNVALQIDNRVEVAAVADPLSGDVYWSDGLAAYIRRGGADQPVHPDSRSKLVDIDLYYPPDAEGKLRVVGLLTEPGFMQRFQPRATGTTLATTWVASGRRAGYLTDGPAFGSVHFAAGVAICQAAGCIVTDFRGDRLNAESTGLVVAADRTTHEYLVAMVKSFLDP
jgi:myo-inositol-1(or 4)-monophosphatase